jgi:hypothetical protein
MNFSKEEREILCVGFIQYAFNEMQTHGWTERRNAFYDEFHIGQYEFERFQMDTFENVMRTAYDGDLDKTIYHFFCNEVAKRGWFACYCIQQRPELKDRFNREIDENACYLAWLLDSQLIKWIWDNTEELKDEFEGLYESDNTTDKIKSILGLDICLK